jgi:hypothetical protein
MPERYDHARAMMQMGLSIYKGLAFKQIKKTKWA